MNYTLSGIIAQGAEMSSIRLRNEAAHAIENGYQNLFLTNEGNHLKHLLFCSFGCDSALMDDEHQAEYMEEHSRDVDHFLRGVIACCFL